MPATTLSDFKKSVASERPADGLSATLAALWWAAKGDWSRAHAIVMDDASDEAAWVHAYLHRVEGDIGNAGYWYRRAGKPVATSALESEWAEIAAALLAEI